MEKFKNIEKNQLAYKTNTANVKEIRTHLQDCSDSFIPPLEKKVNIDEYSKKINEKATTFESWSNGQLVGLVAAYFNETEKIVFITNVSIIKDFRGQGISSTLLEKCIQQAKQNNFHEINLEVSRDNIKAITLYKKFGFVDYGEKDDNLLMKLVDF